MVPKRKRLSEAEIKRTAELAKEMPNDPEKARRWMAQVMAGVEDNREAQFARVRQRLVVFTNRKHATARAKKETNEFWSGKVRPVKIV